MCDKPDRPNISDLKVTFNQEPDSCDETSVGCQLIEVEAIDMGGGYFFRLSTERWAINDADELADLIQRVKGMLER